MKIYDLSVINTQIVCQ